MTEQHRCRWLIPTAFLIIAIVTFGRAHAAHALGQPRGVQSCDRNGNCHWCEYVGNGTYDCR